MFKDHMDPKILGITGGIGTLGAGGIYLAVANPFKTEEKILTISELIKNEAFFKPLTKDTKDDTKWNEAWKKYRDFHKTSTSENTYKDTDVWGLSEWKAKKSGDVAFEEFKNKCEEKSKAKVSSSSPEYKDFKNYCARPKTVAELIGEDAKTTLLKKQGSEQGDWNNAWEKYRKANLESGRTDAWKSQDIWSVDGWSGAKGNSVAIEQYKTKCEEQAGKDINTSIGLKDENFIRVKDWCTKS